MTYDLVMWPSTSLTYRGISCYILTQVPTGLQLFKDLDNWKPNQNGTHKFTGKVIKSYRSNYSGIFYSCGYSCQFIKSFRPFHSFWEEDDLSGRSIQAFQNDTIIISWLFSFRVFQATVQWHTFKTFMFVLSILVHHKNFFVKYLISIDLLWLSEIRYKPKLSHGLICHFMLDRFHWCAKQRNRTSVLLDVLWYT